MHIRNRYHIQDFWIPRPENVRLQMPCERYYKMLDETDGTLSIFGNLYKIIGENQSCGMIEVRVEKLF